VPVRRRVRRTIHANTMATVSEAIGLALPIGRRARAYEIRDAFCMTAGSRSWKLIVANIRPRDIVTRRSLETPRRCGGIRRLDQCCAAPAGDRA